MFLTYATWLVSVGLDVLQGTIAVPGFVLPSRFRSLVGATVLGKVIQLLGLGIGLRLVGVPPLKVVVSTRLAPWEA